MKVTKFVALMVALAAGSASAAGTAAGTLIKNVATATFTNPVGGQKVSIKSNEVITQVLAKPRFDVVFADATDDGGNQNKGDTTTVVKRGFIPGSLVTTEYAVTNTGNVDLSVAIARDEDNKGAGNKDPEFVKYYAVTADANKDGNLSQDEINQAQEITKVDVAKDGEVKFFQVIKVPASALPTDTFAASPEGKVVGTGYNIAAGQNGVDPSVTLFEGQTITSDAGGANFRIEKNPAENSDLQYVRVELITPAITNTPTNPGIPNIPVNPTNPQDPNKNPPKPTNPGNNVVPPPTTTGPVGPQTPGSGTPNKPTNPTIPNPNDPNTNVPTKPGYTDPSRPSVTGTPIVKVDADNQAAYPVGDKDTTDDVVTFVNDTKNGGTANDQVTIEVQKGTPLPAGVTATVNAVYRNGQFVPDENPTKEGYQVTIRPNETVSYTTKVTYPDNDNSPTKREPIVVKLDVISGNNNTVKATTTDTIYPPAMLFADTSDKLGGTQVVQTQRVVPGAANNNNTSDTTNDKDSRAVFPMDVANTGAYNDSYTLTGEVTLNGEKVAVKYFDKNGVELPQSNEGKHVTPVLAPGEEVTVYAVVDVKAGVPAGEYEVNQTAKGNYSEIEIKDTNNKIVVAAAGELVIGKFTQSPTAYPIAAETEFIILGGTVQNNKVEKSIANPENYSASIQTSYLPGVAYNYKIIAKSFLNAQVPDLALGDIVDENLTVNSVSCQRFGANGVALGNAVPGQFVAQGNKTNATCAPVALNTNESYEMTLNVQIK